MFTIQSVCDVAVAKKKNVLHFRFAEVSHICFRSDLCLLVDKIPSADVRMQGDYICAIFVLVKQHVSSEITLSADLLFEKRNVSDN